MIYVKNFLFKTRLCLIFYKKLILISIFITAFMKIWAMPLIAVISMKLILLSALFLYFRFIEAKDHVLFYRNFGITPVFLFAVSFFMDLILSILIYKIANLF